MKRLLTLLFAINLLTVNAQSGLLSGTGSAPDFTVSDINGVSHTLYNYLDSGYVMVVEIMFTTCGYCQQHAAGTENSYQTNGPEGNNTARFLALETHAATDSAALADFKDDYGVTFPIANDISAVAIDYQVYYFPGYYVIYPDRSYTTICPQFCVNTNTFSTIETLLDNAIASWSPPTYGCTGPTYGNYNSAATVDDGSCEYTSCVTTTCNGDPIA